MSKKAVYGVFKVRPNGRDFHTTLVDGPMGKVEAQASADAHNARDRTMTSWYVWKRI